MGYGLTTAAPGGAGHPRHMGFAVFMGLFYGRAKLCADQGCRGRKRNLWAAYLSAVVLHGFYDACALIGTALSALLFLAFVIVMYIVVIRMVKKQSRTDAPV
jgi:RsiW-degrading membrane proteinase PrsW (M82 family)